MSDQPVSHGYTLSATGEMASRVHAFNWAESPLGPIEGWPRALRNTVNLVLDNRFPAIMGWGEELTVIYNDAYRPILGDKPEALGRPLLDVWWEASEIIEPLVQRALQGEASYFDSTRFTLMRNGYPEEAWFDFSFSPLRDEDGRVAGVLNTGIEVTARIQTEEALRQSETKYRTLFESIDDGFCIIEFLRDADGEFVDFRYEEANPALARHSGLSGVVGRTVREVLPDEADEWIEIYRHVARTGGSLRFEHRLEATDRILELHAFRAEGDDPARVAIVFRDVTARRRAEDALAVAREETVRREQAARERMEAAIEYAPAALALLRGPRHIFTLANPRYLELIGVRDVIGRPVSEVLPEIEGQGYLEVLDRVYATGEPFVATESPVWLDREGTGELSAIYVNFLYAPTRSGDGEIDGVFVHVYEVTAQVEARLEAEQAREEAEDAVRAREEFLSIASHELRNPVAALRGTAQLMARARESGRLTEARLGTYIDALISSAGHLATLTDDLLDVARLQRGALPLRTGSEDLAALVREIVRRGDWPEHRLTLEVDGEPLEAVIDRDRVSQVIYNLVDNATKYSPEGEDVRVRLQPQDGGFLLEVEDAGIGLPPDSVESIFTPFGRAPNAADANIPGLGLGLYIARRIAEQHGGRLWAQSEGPGQGTLMSLWLPRARITDGSVELESPPRLGR